MPLVFSAAIDQEVDKAHLSVVDLIQVDFGNGLERRWSTIRVPASFASDLSGNYEARLISIGSRRWSLGADDDSVNLVMGDADDAISNFVRSYGIDIFEGAKVRHHRLFPGIKEVYKDYWVGKGSGLTFSDLTASWDVRFGLGALRQRALRRFQRNCAHVFAGGLDSDCPYSPENGFGVPQPLLFGAATFGTTDIKLRNSGAGAFDRVYAGMLAYNRTANCVSKVLDVVSAHELRLSNPVAGAGTGDTPRWRFGDKYAIGPPYVSCDKTTAACDARGMYGPNNRNPVGLADGRKYFGGSNDVANVIFRGRLPETGDRFTRRTLGNDSLDGNIIPVIFGRIRIYGQESIAHANDGRFQHGIFILCEGQVSDIYYPIVNNRPPDNVNNLNNVKSENNFVSGDAAAAHSDSFTKFGTWAPNGVDDERADAVNAKLSLAIARHVRGLHGTRVSVATQYRNRILDAYDWRQGGNIINNPYLFADTVGGGLSLHGLVAARVRIETNEDDDSVLDGDFSLFGLLTPLPDIMPANSEDGGFYNIPKNVAGVVPLKYTAVPNPIQAAYAFLVNRRWGAGLSDQSIHLDAIVAESNYCEQIINASAAPRTQIRGTVDAVPNFVRGMEVPDNRRFYTHSVTTGLGRMIDTSTYIQSLAGREIVFNPQSPGSTFKAQIEASRYFATKATAEAANKSDDDPDDDSDWAFTSGGDKQGYVIHLDVKPPDPGTPFIISGKNKRYKANGALADNTTVVEMFQSILDNCHGIFRMTAGKIEVIIKKALSADEIDTVISERLFTDRGPKRNIIYQGETSSLKVWRDNIEDVVNEYSVEFPDERREYHISRIIIVDDNAQMRAAIKLGETGDRRKITEETQLTLTSSLDQAARILALRARESIIQNLFCSFTTSLKTGMRIQPGDIIAVDSNKIIGLFNTQILLPGVSYGDAFLFRVTEKVESAAYTIAFTCKLHVNSIYNDVIRDFGEAFSVFQTAAPKIGIASNVIPLEPEENTFVDQYNRVQSQIKVKVTYPES